MIFAGTGKNATLLALNATDGGATLWLGPIEKLAGSLYVELINEELLVPISEVQIRQLFCLQ